MADRETHKKTSSSLTDRSTYIDLRSRLLEQVSKQGYTPTFFFENKFGEELPSELVKEGLKINFSDSILGRTLRSGTEVQLKNLTERPELFDRLLKILLGEDCQREKEEEEIYLV